MISVVVLAARHSRQPADQNRSLPPEETSVLQQILENLLASDADEVICVTDDLGAAREIKLSDSRLIWHFNPIAMHGQSTSVVAGL